MKQLPSSRALSVAKAAMVAKVVKSAAVIGIFAKEFQLFSEFCESKSQIFRSTISFASK